MKMIRQGRLTGGGLTLNHWIVEASHWLNPCFLVCEPFCVRLAVSTVRCTHQVGGCPSEPRVLDQCDLLATELALLPYDLWNARGRHTGLPAASRPEEDIPEIPRARSCLGPRVPCWSRHPPQHSPLPVSQRDAEADATERRQLRLGCEYVEMEITDGTTNVGEPADRCGDAHLASISRRTRRPTDQLGPFREPFLRVDLAVRGETGRIGGGRRLRPVHHRVSATGRVGGPPPPRDALAGEDGRPGKGLVLCARLVTAEGSLAAGISSGTPCSRNSRIARIAEPRAHAHVRGAVSGACDPL